MPQVGHHLGVGKYVCGQLDSIDNASLMVSLTKLLDLWYQAEVQMMYPFIKTFLNLLCTSIITLLTG